MVQPNKAVMDYFEKGVKKGISLEKLSDNLLSQGWPKGNVDVSLREFKNKSLSNFNAPRPVEVNHFHDSVQAGRIPPALNVVSILHFLLAVSMLLIPILIFIFGPSFLGIEGIDFVGGFLGGVLIVLSLPFIILFLIIGVKLRKGRNWAKIVALIFSILGLIGGISIIFGGIVIFSIPYIVIYGFVVWALLFDKHTKEFFKAKRNQRY